MAFSDFVGQIGNMFAQSPGANNGASWAETLSGLGGLWGNLQSMQNNNAVNQQVQPAIQQNQDTLRNQINALQGQIDTNRQQAQDMYQRSLADVTAQNQGLEGNIGTWNANLDSIRDPNSAYMQQARQAIERKDAAAGRRSQWGERETQLSAQLAEQYNKYAPGLQQQISGARGQIARNNEGLAQLYSTANNPADRNTMSQMTALQQQLAAANAANTTGRAAMNAQSNAQTAMLGNGIKLLGGLGGLFGNRTSGGGGMGYGDTSNYGFLGGNTYGDGWGTDQGLGYGMGQTGGALGGGYLDMGSSGSLGGGYGNLGNASMGNSGFEYNPSYGAGGIMAQTGHYGSNSDDIWE